MARVRWIGRSLMVALVATATFAGARGKDDDEKKPDFAAPAALAPAAPRAAFKASPGRMGATPGGAQDIDFARDRILAGEIPHASTFTAEGLLSQHDLPLPSSRECKQILCLSAAATRADLIAQPEVRHLAQLGFASNLDPRTWRRAPLNLVAVVDKSGSMSGDPLETVKASLRQVAGQMSARDQMSIVLYGDTSHVHLAPTSLSKKDQVLAAIDGIQSAGSTAMEEGLRVGFDVAQRTSGAFRGTTRVMLFTDERPNVGATDAGSFMGMARAGSRRGVGMTTVGVGTHFGAELATAISSVRGGNLFFFPDVAAMKQRFVKDFDTMVTELAHDMKLVVEPNPGFRLVGLYGLPGELVKRTPSGGLEMALETVFLSREAGGIFFGFAPDTHGAIATGSGAVGRAVLAYTDASGRRESDELAFDVVAPDAAPLGLRRGLLLVDQITTLKQASVLHGQQNATEPAYRLVRALEKKLRESTVSGLDRERDLVAKLHETLTRLSGHQGEAPAPIPRDAVSGMPRGPVLAR